ncbi:hypothetical protein Sjap_015744 [Stephania japonica]|uniref:non-specific serine/threonine protein kinase n=1 Tax=Stephania japonica TaxID=461633 RepID=A0AAP0NR56_9MAGN
MLQLEVLDLASNNLIAPIPSTLGSLTKLTHLFLQNNRINEATCWKDTKGLLQYGNHPPPPVINLTNNMLTGPVLSDTDNSSPQLFCEHLCLKVQNSPSSKIVHHKGIFLFYKQRMSNKQIGAATRKHGNIFSIWNYDGVIAYEDIIDATENFDFKYCIGIGAYGSVYKALLPSGQVVALKKLHNWERENSTFDRSFANEVQVLTKIRHRNIVKLYGFCCHPRCSFLVYEYLEKGSLFEILRDEAEAEKLNWKKGVNIIEGISKALSYMHHHCSPPIVHRDVSSNNILLDSKFEAHVSDFGTARLLQPNFSYRTVLAGSSGYIAPGNFGTIFGLVVAGSPTPVTADRRRPSDSPTGQGCPPCALCVSSAMWVLATAVVVAMNGTVVEGASSASSQSRSPKLMVEMETFHCYSTA